MMMFIKNGETVHPTAWVPWSLDGSGDPDTMVETQPINATPEQLTAMGVIVVEDDPLPPPPQVPIIVTALQGRLAINTVPGLRDQVEAVIEAGGQNTKDFWSVATVWHRDNPLLNSLAQALGLSSQQVDDLFGLAATLS